MDRIMSRNTFRKENDRFVKTLKEMILSDNEDRRINTSLVSNREINEIIIDCSFCGNRGINRVVGSRRQIFEETYAGRTMCDEFRQIFMLECPVCSQVTLVSYDWNINALDNEGNPKIKKQVLYPKYIHSFPSAPSHIVEAYESARRTVHIDNSISLIAVRKVLELICKERGSKKKQLEAMLKDLVSRGILPDTLDKCSLLIRKLGNAGAHDAEEEFYVENDDLEELISLLETIITYLYELPAKISRLNERYINE